MSGADTGHRHIDEAALVQLVDDLGPEHVAELCELFLADAGERIQALRTACDEGDADAAARSAHRLKSASGFVGARGISGLCHEIEELARGGRLDAVPARADVVSAELAQASVEMATLLGRLRRPG